MEFCTRCKENWFRAGVVKSICAKCRTTRDSKKKDDEPFLMSAANSMDPGTVPPHLLKLTQVEEMLIARVHCFVEVHQVRGQQYKYSGHVCNFLCDIGKVYTKLPLLPKDLEIVLLKPADTANNPGLSRQFKKDYKVRRTAVTIWLEYLSQHHPGYSDIEIDRAALSQLPENDSIEDQLAVHHMPALDEVIDSEVELDEEEREVAAVPDLLAEHSEIEQLQHAVGAVPHLTQPGFRSTPLQEFNRSQPLLSLAFPTLFPHGEAEFVNARVRRVDYSMYIEHLMKFHDSRFARHPRFRYVVFNTLMRQQVSKKSTYFATKMQDGEEELDMEAIQAAFVNPDDP